MLSTTRKSLKTVLSNNLPVFSVTTASLSTLSLEADLVIPATPTEGYRRLLRAQRKLFVGDSFAQSQARREIRHHFNQNSNVTDTVTLSNLLKGIAEAEDMLLHGVMQGRLNEDTGNYGKKLNSLLSFIRE